MTNDRLWLVTLLVLVLLASIQDVRSRKIPNLLNAAGILIGFGIQFSLSGWPGVGTGLAGLMVGLCSLLPLYVFGSMGAGDVKLMAAVGVFLGPLEVLAAGLFSVLAGGIFAVALIALRGELSKTAGRYLTMLTHLMAVKHAVYLPPAPEDVAARRMAYAPAIAAGTIAALFYFSHIDLPGG